jgi:hypothetical protein
MKHAVNSLGRAELQEDLFAPNSPSGVKGVGRLDGGQFGRSAALWETLAERAESLGDRRTAASAWGAAASARRRAGQPYPAVMDDIRGRDCRDRG